MEKDQSAQESLLSRKIGTYRGYDVIINPKIPKEAIANMSPDGNNVPIAIAIRPDAYRILQVRPDYLERIYAHELQEHTTEESVKHGQDNEILIFLRDNGYDFGDFKF